MALSQREKELITADFITGKYSQRELAKKYNVSIGTVSNLTKGLERKNEHLVDAQISLFTAKAHISDAEMNAILNTAQELVFNQGLIVNASQLNVVRMTQLLRENKKVEKINVGGGMQSFEEVGLGSSDYKNIQDALHKAGQSLGVIDQFAPRQEQSSVIDTEVIVEIE